MRDARPPAVRQLPHDRIICGPGLGDYKVPSMIARCRPTCRKPMWTLCSGVPIGSRHPEKGVVFACRFTACVCHKMGELLLRLLIAEIVFSVIKCAPFENSAAQGEVLHTSKVDLDGIII